MKQINRLPASVAVVTFFCLLGTVITAPHAHAQRAGTPYAALHVAGDTLHWLEGAPLTLTATLGPPGARLEAANGATLRLLDAALGLYEVQMPAPRGTSIISVRATYRGRSAAAERLLVVEEPQLRAQRHSFTDDFIVSGIDAWGALSARVGTVYDPTTEFNNPYIPAAQYMTIVTIRGDTALKATGLFFRNLNAAAQQRLTIPPGLLPREIVTKVYWRPGDTWDARRWVLLLCNQEGSGATIPLEKRLMRIDPAVNE